MPCTAPYTPIICSKSGVYMVFFHILFLNIGCGYSLETVLKCAHNICFEKNNEIYKFSAGIFHFIYTFLYRMDVFRNVEDWLRGLSHVLFLLTTGLLMSTDLIVIREESIFSQDFLIWYYSFNNIGIF